MTAIRERKTRLTFETDATIQGREVIIEVGTHTASVRLKGTQKRLAISWEGIYVQAAKIEAARMLAEKKAQCKCTHSRTMHRKGRDCRKCLCSQFEKRGTR